MSTLSQFLGGATPLGAVRPAVYNGPILTTNGSQEWLIERYAVTYASKYAPLLTARLHHLLTAAVPEQKALTLSNEASGIRIAAKLYWSATAAKYLLVGQGSSGVSPVAEHAAGASIAALAEAVYPGTNNGVVDSAQFADGSVVTLHGGTSTNAATRFPGTTFTPASLSFGSTNRFFVAATGAIGVACGNGASNAANGINVSSDSGATWAAAVTGSNGIITAMRALRWSPCANAFLWVGTNGSNVAVLTSTSGAPQTQTTRYNTTGFLLSDCNAAWLVANSPTVTLIAGQNRALLRSTDGISWSVVHPEVQAAWSLDAPDGLSNLAVAHDGTYFYCWPDQNSANVIGTLASPPRHYARILRSTDGLAWEPCICPEPETIGRIIAGLLFANGLRLAAIAGSNEINSLRDFDAVLTNAPQFVRAPGIEFSSEVSGQVRIK